MYCLPLADLSSVQLEILSNYIYGIQAAPHVQDLNKLISVHFRHLSDIWISFFTKIDSLITTILVFTACCDTLNNTFTIF